MIAHTSGRWSLSETSMLAAAVCLAVIVAGCSPVDQARQSLRRGEPVRAVQLYQQAVADDPQDHDARVELAQAKVAAGDLLADQARDALAAGRLADAVDDATQAALHDPAHRPLEQQARRTYATDLLRQSDAALSQSNFVDARRLAAAALEVAHTMAEPVSALASIDRAQAEDLRRRLDALLDAGNFDDAARLAKRAASLQPGDQEFAQLPGAVEQRRRESVFDARAIEARAAIDDGRLGAFWPIHAQLAALNVRRDQLKNLQQQFAAREQQLHDTVAAAETARRQGNFDRAVGLYQVAESIATDRPDLAEQRIAVENLRTASELQRSGIAAMDDGAYEDAIDALRRSLQLNAIDETDQLLRTAERRWHRQAYENALEYDNLASAVDHLGTLLRIAPDENLDAMLGQLRLELVEASLAEASALHSDGDTQTALHVLRRAMNRVHDPRLDQLHAALTAEQLLQQAVAADQAQAFDKSRELYLQALAAGGDRIAIENRISDIRVLDDMQRKQRAAEQDARELGSALNSTRLQLQSRENENRDLLEQIRDCEAEIDRLVHALRQADYDVRHERSRSRALAAEVYSLKCEIDRLRNDLRRARRDAQRARSISARRRDHDSDDPRRPRAQQ